MDYRHTEEEKGVKYRYLDDGGSTGKGLFSGSPLNLNINLNYTGDQVPASNYGATYDQKFSNDSGSATIAYQLTDDTRVRALGAGLPQRRLQRRDLRRSVRRRDHGPVGAGREVRPRARHAAPERIGCSSTKWTICRSARSLW